MSEPIKVAFGSGTAELVPKLVEHMLAIRPDLPLYVVSEFQVAGARWIPYYVGRTHEQNLALCRSVFHGKQIVLSGVLLQPRQPYWPMRRLAASVAGLWRTAFFNENLDHFMLRPRSAGTIARHFFWRFRSWVRWQIHPGGTLYTILWRLWHPWAFLRPLAYRVGMISGALAAMQKWGRPPACGGLSDRPFKTGISVVIPSRSGRDLLERLLPNLIRELNGLPNEVIVSDNGSDDGTAEWLAEQYPRVVVEQRREPLSFARAVNRGIRRARFDKLLLLNNDMTLEPGFFPPLLHAFDRVPGLFCATAQILFPEGERRQETGKAVMIAQPGKDEFPLRCDEPIDGEDLSYVLYGSGGASLIDASKLATLGGLLEIFEPAYVEDLDLGFRAWQRGWPTVFVAGAKVIHRHRTTTSRYYSPEELDRVLEINYLKFLAHSVFSGDVFARLWKRALLRLNHRAARQDPDPAALPALRRSCRALAWMGDQPAPSMSEEAILAIGSGEVAVFPASGPSGKPVVMVASPYQPFPLSHGGAVRMYNLMRRAAVNYDQVLVCFVDELHTPPPELRDICAEIVEVRRRGSHSRALTERPDAVEEFDSLAFREALRQMARKWRPGLLQLEFTQLAQYADAIPGVPSILVEHDVTLDLYRQLLDHAEDWETRQQYDRWVRFETQAWKQVDAVVVMSEKDRRAVALHRAVVLANGVDLDRFRPSAGDPEDGRILFIGSFRHLPNILAVDWFLREVWPRVRSLRDARLHVIAGPEPEFYLDRHRESAQPPLDQEGIELEAFVSDPRPAYDRASVVVAPLLASAGTNIKIMEAMAMGKAIVSTPAGINGLEELHSPADLLVARTAEEMAESILSLLNDAVRRRSTEKRARSTVERLWGWDAIASRQRTLYERLRVRD